MGEGWFYIIVDMLAGAGVTFAAMPLLLKFCRTKGYYDLPGGRKVHHLAVPRLGGVLFMPAMIIRLAGWMERTAHRPFLPEFDRLSRGRVFGESLVCSMSEDSPIQIDALTETEVLYLDFDPLLLQQENGCPYRMRVTANLLREMGKGALFLNQKMRILAQNRLRNRIKVYLQGLPIASNGEIRLEMGRGEMADYLCVDRSALSRELGRMQKEGILTYQGQVVHILDSEFLSA